MPENNSPRLIERAAVALVTSEWVQLECTQGSITSRCKLGTCPQTQPPSGPLCLSQRETDMQQVLDKC